MDFPLIQPLVKALLPELALLNAFLALVGTVLLGSLAASFWIRLTPSKERTVSVLMLAVGSLLFAIFGTFAILVIIVILGGYATYRESKTQG